MLWKKAPRYRKDGPVAVALFEIEGTDTDGRDQRTLRQSQASGVVTAFVEAVG
jgi:hypothetical protein